MALSSIPKPTLQQLLDVLSTMYPDPDSEIIRTKGAALAEPYELAFRAGQRSVVEDVARSVNAQVRHVSGKKTRMVFDTRGGLES